MARYAKKHQNDDTELEDMKLHRYQRKFRGHKLAVNVGASRLERRGGWSEAKRRAAMYS